MKNNKIPEVQLEDEQKQKYKVGLMIFKPGLVPQQINSFLSDSEKILLKRSPVYAFSENQLIKIRVTLKNACQWNISIISAGSFKVPKFLKEIQNIYLPKLVILNLDHNNITSLESICRIQATSLDCLSLIGNEISSVKQFRKSNFPLITRFYIGLADNNYLSEFHSRLLETIQSSPDTKVKIRKKRHNDISWIAKIESPKLRRILTPELDYAITMNRSSHGSLKKRYKNELFITV